MSRRPPATLADYVLVGINPALIMLLIGSLVFFLLEVFYRGEYGFRLNFIFAMFVMGAVAVGRISMEESAGYTALFGMPLALAALFAMSTFVQFGGALAQLSLLINILLVALILWLAYQLTWDCTLLDERADTSDRGLLEAVGLSNDAPADANQAEDALDPQITDRTDAPRDDAPRWMKWFERSKQPHAHGVWVVYFSLAALPMFGLGQWFLPAPSRQWAFLMLVVYCAAALALLLSTSFLGLRRYLRKRRLEMPLEMTGAWLGIGGMLIVAVLLVCTLIPRPGAEVGIGRLPEALTITSEDLSPSRWGWGEDGQKHDPNAAPGGEGKENSTEQGKTAEGQEGEKGKSSPEATKGESGQQTGQPQTSGENGSKSGGEGEDKQQADGEQGNKGNRTGESGKQGEGKQGEGKQGERQPAQAKSNDATTSQQANSSEPRDSESSTGVASSTRHETSPQSQPSSPQSSSKPWTLNGALGNLATIVKLLLYVAIAAVLACLAWRYRRELAAAWRQFWKEWAEFWARLFGSEGRSDSVDPAMTLPQKRPFSAYSDPFATGQAARASRRELVRYSFEALQAWGREHACEREESETPHEYAERIAMTAPHLAQEAAILAEHYGLVAYAGSQAPPTIVEPLKALWGKMSAYQRAGSPMAAAR